MTIQELIDLIDNEGLTAPGSGAVTAFEDGRDHGPSGYGWRRPPHAYDASGWGRGDDHRGYGARFDTPCGTGFPDQPDDVYPLGADPYEEVAAPVAPPVDEVQGPDVGCRIRRSESITAAGWRKIVAHETCYGR